MFFICIRNGLQAILEKQRQQLRKRKSPGTRAARRSALVSHHLRSSSEITFDLLPMFVFRESRPLFWPCQHSDQSAGAVLQSAESKQDEVTADQAQKRKRDKVKIGAVLLVIHFSHILFLLKARLSFSDKVFALCRQSECQRALFPPLLFYKAISVSLQALLIVSWIIPLCLLGCFSQGCRDYHGLNYNHI